MTVYYQNVTGSPKILYYYADKSNWSADGRPTIAAVYSGNDFQPLTIDTRTPAIGGQSRSVIWHPNDDHIVIANSSTSGSVLYKKEANNTITNLSTVGNSQSVNYISYSKDGTLLFIGYVAAPRLQGLQRSGDTYSTSGVTFDSIFAAQHTGVEPTHDDGLLLTSNNATLPRVYSRSGTAFTSLGTTPFGANTPTGTSQVFKSAHGINHFASVTTGLNPTIQVFTVSGSTFTQVFTEVLTGFSQSFTASNLTYTPDDSKLYYIDSTGVRGYTISGTTYTPISSVVSPTPTGVNHGAITPDGLYIMLTRDASGSGANSLYSINQSTGVLTFVQDFTVTAAGGKNAFSNTVL